MSASPTPAWIAEEQAALSKVLPALRALQDKDREQDRALSDRMKDHHREWTDAYGLKTDRALLEEALDDDAMQIRAHRAAQRSREIPLGTPYFGRLVLQEGRRAIEVLLGKVGVVGGGLNIVDWRNAPISRLFYEYQEEEEYAEEIAGREREGVVKARRRLDIREGNLVEAERKSEVLRLSRDGSWVAPETLRGREEREDHRLPDIVSLITREQFAVITRPEAGVVLLRGRAGSGKTTVALHRVAWLHYQDPVRFRPDRMLIVMFNKALQTYIANVLPDLGLKGVPVETFHGWAGRMLRKAGVTAVLQADTPQEVGRLKRHPGLGALLDAQLRRLGERSLIWLEERLPAELKEALVATPGQGLARVHAWRKGLRDTTAARAIAPLWGRLRARLLDHARDLYALFEDQDLAASVLPAELHRHLPAAAAHMARLQRDGAMDYADAALLLRFGQRKTALDPDLHCPWAGTCSHIVIDEAQDLSTVEISALVDAADTGRSVTIAGDPAQRIQEEAQFEGFEQLLERLGTGQLQVRLDALQVGHRSTRPIMALALDALGANDLAARAALASSRDGDPVSWLTGAEATPAAAAEQIRAFRSKRPMSLVAVLCKRKEQADRWVSELGLAGLSDVRRADRAGFSFQAGVVVSNVHQVKGLEFDGVVLVDPADYGQRDRHLLHVAITRAADQLWVVAPRGPGLLSSRVRGGQSARG